MRKEKDMGGKNNGLIFHKTTHLQLLLFPLTFTSEFQHSMPKKNTSVLFENFTWPGSGGADNFM